MNPRTGILGGGQLSLMLREAAEKLGFTPKIFTADLHNVTQLRSFLDGCETVVFENEFVDVAMLSRAAALVNSVPEFVPDLDVIARVSEKLEQKKIFAELEIPSAEYLVFPGGPALAWLAEVSRKLGSSFVVKWSKHGYDGKGNHFVRSEADWPEAGVFTQRADGRGTAVYAEKAVLFKRELAIEASYSVKGDLEFYPLVISEQRAGVCKWVEGPATSLGVPKALEEKARGIAEKIAKKIALHGTFAIELFETDDGLLVNELAPRVHNTGHYSIEGTACSQFENHWRAALGEPLGQPLPKSAAEPFFGMINLLAPDGVVDEVVPAALPGAFLHWYGKTGFTPGRKLGHVTVTAKTAAELKVKRQELESYDEKWKDACIGLGHHGKRLGS